MNVCLCAQGFDDRFQLMLEEKRERSLVVKYWGVSLVLASEWIARKRGCA